MARPYDVQEVELKWQQRWADSHLYEVDADDPRPAQYVLCMYPYPSGSAHQGHVRNYTFGDLLVRHRTMQGFAVLSPFGFDSFGLPGRERRHPDRRASPDLHRGPDRRAQGQREAPRCRLRLAARDAQPRPVLHPVEPGHLPAAARGRPGLPRPGAGQLVPGLPDGAGQRAGAGGRDLRALGRPRRPARARAVVLPHHRLRRRAARRARRRWTGPSGSRPCSATGSAGPRGSSSTSQVVGERVRRARACGSSPPGPTRASG